MYRPHYLYKKIFYPPFPFFHLSDVYHAAHLHLQLMCKLHINATVTCCTYSSKLEEQQYKA